jgi:exocyst complex component 5
MQGARDAYIDRLDSSDLPASQKAMLLRIAGLKDTDSRKSEIEVTEEDGQLHVAHAKRMLKWLAEGVGRSLELNGGNESPKDIQGLLGVVLTQMGEIYLDSALGAATDLAAAQESVKTEPDFTYLPPLRSGVQILHLLQTTINTMLLPLATSNITIRREIEKSGAATLAQLESKISAILHKTLDSSLAWTSRLLTAQKKTDFRPSETELERAIESLQTPTCLSIFTFLSKAAGLASQSLDGSNLSGFLAELAAGLRGLLLEHLRRFSVSLSGGLIVSKDVTKYAELVREWPLAGTAFAEREGGMRVLVEVANLFVIGPEALRERLKGGGGVRSREDVAELRKYVEKREDASSVGVQAVLSTV